MLIIYDCETVARAQVRRDILIEYVSAPDVDVTEILKALGSREGVAVCYKNRVRIKRLTGDGWYQFSGYREDGQDLALALFNLQNAERIINGRNYRASVAATALQGAGN